MPVPPPPRRFPCAAGLLLALLAPILAEPAPGLPPNQAADPDAEVEWMPLSSFEFGDAPPKRTPRLVDPDPASPPPVVVAEPADGVLRITEVRSPSLALFRAEGNDDPAPGVLVLPGGGYRILSVDQEGVEVCRWLAAHGYTAALLRYRVPDERDNAFMNAVQAMRVLRRNAPDLGIDPHRLGVLGFSAGGHLAARLGANPPGGDWRTDPETFPRPYHPHPDEFETFRPDFAVLVYPAYLGDGPDHAVSPEVTPGRNTPPTLILQAEDDRAFVAGSHTYARALEAAAIPHRFPELADGGHGYGLHPRKESAASRWPALCLDWLAELKLPAPRDEVPGEAS